MAGRYHSPPRTWKPRSLEGQAGRQQIRQCESGQPHAHPPRGLQAYIALSHTVQMLWFLHERWKVRLDDGTYISFKLRARPPWEVQAQIALSCTVQCCGDCSCVGSSCTCVYTFMMHIYACSRSETMSIGELAVFRNVVKL